MPLSDFIPVRSDCCLVLLLLAFLRSGQRTFAPLLCERMSCSHQFPRPLPFFFRVRPPSLWHVRLHASRECFFQRRSPEFFFAFSEPDVPRRRPHGHSSSFRSSFPPRLITPRNTFLQLLGVLLILFEVHERAFDSHTSSGKV